MMADPRIVSLALFRLWSLSALLGFSSGFEVRQNVKPGIQIEVNTHGMRRRVSRAAAQPCPGTVAGASASVPHAVEVEALIDAFNTAEFRDLPGETSGEKRSYTYDCTLGKGKSEAVIIRARINGDAGRNIALKVAFQPRDKTGKSPEQIAKSKTELKNEAEMMAAAHGVKELAEFVPKPGPHGPSKSKTYYYMEMPEVGLTLDAELIKQDGTKGSEWKKNFEAIMAMVIKLHNGKELAKCFVHGDVHLGNVARHKTDDSKFYLIDWGRAKRCTTPGKPFVEANIDPTAMSNAIVKELLQMALLLASCACDTVADGVKMFGKPLACFYGDGKANAKAYPSNAAAKFASLDTYLKKPKDWATMQDLQEKVTGLVKNPNYELK